MTYVWIKLAVLAIAATGVAVKALREAHHRTRARKRMAAATSDFDDTALVTIRGKVQLVGEPLIAPLSGRICVAHQTRARLIGKAVPGGLLMGGLRTVAGEYVRVEMRPFRLATRDGDVIVEGAKPELAIRPRPVIPRKLDRELAFLRESEYEATPDEMTFDEVVIEPGATIKVHGIARVEIASGEAQFREAPRIRKLVGDDRHPLTISER